MNETMKLNFKIKKMASESRIDDLEKVLKALLDIYESNQADKYLSMDLRILILESKKIIDYMISEERASLRYFENPPDLDDVHNEVKWK